MKTHSNNKFIDKVNQFTENTRNTTNVMVEKRRSMLHWCKHKYLPMLLFFITFGVCKPNKTKSNATGDKRS